MSQFSSQQRKLIYLIGIIVLLIPITRLSLPSELDREGKRVAGGTLSELRHQYDLGEADLGGVDASGTAVNFVLLGMRGIAVSFLCIEQDEQKDMKRWAEMQATTKSIVRLQPHYEKVWDMAGWNLAYNTSAEWDAVPDRYYWVKQGALLLKDGVARNKKSTTLHYCMGKVLQQKLGLADEAVEYRRYFVKDPDPAFNGGPDPAINPEGKDNYLVAKEWFQKACECELTRPQHIIDRSLFRATPARCQFDYAQGLQKDGKFGEETRAAWEQARQDWTVQFGGEIQIAQMGRYTIPIRLEVSDEDIKQEARTEDEEKLIRHAVDQYQKIVNYRYWRMRANAESELDTAEAHRNFFEARKLLIAQDFEKARAAAFSGMDAFDKLFRRPEYASLMEEDSLQEECLLGWKIWDDLHQIMQEPVPAEFPLKWFIQMIQSKRTDVVENVNRQFKRLFLETR